MAVHAIEWRITSIYLGPSYGPFSKGVSRICLTFVGFYEVIYMGCFGPHTFAVG